jgi:hypothetical protein
MHWMLGEPANFMDRVGINHDGGNHQGDDFVPAMETTPVDPALLDYLLSELQGQGLSMPHLNHRNQTASANREEVLIAEPDTGSGAQGSQSRFIQTREHSPNADDSVENRWRELELHDPMLSSSS